MNDQLSKWCNPATIIRFHNTFFPFKRYKILAVVIQSFSTSYLFDPPTLTYWLVKAPPLVSIRFQGQASQALDMQRVILVTITSR